MLRNRVIGKSGEGPGPEPPKPPVVKENTITFEINYTEGEVVLNNSGDGITYTKVTTNLKGKPEISGAGGKQIRIPFNSRDFTPSGEKVLKLKAFVEKYNPDINSFISANLGTSTYEHSMMTIDFSDFDAASLTGINGFLKKSGVSTLVKLDLNNLDAPKLASLTDKNSPGFWQMSIFYEVFSYDGVVQFTNFKTPALSNIAGMFQNTGVKSVDLSGLDTTSVTNMERFFDQCYSVIEFKLMTPVNNLTNVKEAFTYMSGTGTFYYNKNYDYSKITLKGWTRTPV